MILNKPVARKNKRFLKSIISGLRLYVSVRCIATLATMKSELLNRLSASSSQISELTSKFRLPTMMAAWFSNVRDRSRLLRFCSLEGAANDLGRLRIRLRWWRFTRHAYRHPSRGILPKLGFPWRRTKYVGGTYYKFRLDYYLHNMSVVGEGQCWSYPLLGCKLIVCQTPVKSVMAENVHFKQITPKTAL